jgi:filamentous hemagglutinin family protein
MLNIPGWVCADSGAGPQNSGQSETPLSRCRASHPRVASLPRLVDVARRYSGAGAARTASILCGASFIATAVLPVAVAQAADLPTAGQVVSGSGSISESGTTMTVTQTSAKLGIDWQDFSIGAGHTVNFVQPSSTSVALNRVLGSDPSVIQGALNANGMVFLVNPNGILFTPGAQVNVGGLVASTQGIGDDDFAAGRYSFRGTSDAAVTNQGAIHAAQGGTVALIAATIVNDGSIVADGGSVLMGAGNTVTLDMGGPVRLQVDEGALDTLIEQHGAIRADGGHVYLTARAAGDLSSSVINQTGVIEARTLATGEKGEIVLLGDMTHGRTAVAGTLDASAPAGGDGGFIETSAASVDVADGATITAGAATGRGGTWLIDPYDYTIDATAAANIAGALNTGTSVTVDTTVDDASYGSAGSGVNGDITVNSAITKTTGGEATLTLQAADTIVLNAEIKSTANKLNLLLDADNDNGSRDGGGVIIANKGVSLNGGNLDFGTGASISINGVSTMVGGDLYIGGTDKVIFATGGGHINLNGELMIANTEGVNFTSSNGDISFAGIINSGNQYERVYNSSGYYTWQQAFDDAKNGTAGGSAVGDSYLATVTSRLENAVVVYTGDFPAPVGDNITDLSNGAWLGGARTNGVWSWRSGPEGEENGGLGLTFMNNNVAVSGVFNNWKPGEPNGGTGGSGEDRLQIGDARGRWNDLVNDDGSVHIRTYIRETNLGTANLEIDAGSGQVSFAQDIGGLKAINYKAYDASNPKPSETTTAATGSVPQTSAVSTVQAAASATPASGPVAGTPNTAVSTGFAPVQFVSPAAGPAVGGGPVALTVGSLDIVRLRSADLPAASAPGASGVAAGGTPDGNTGETAGGQPAGQDATGFPDVPQLAGQAGLLGPTKVFVIDGGIRQRSDTDNQ